MNDLNRRCYARSSENLFIGRLEHRNKIGIDEALTLPAPDQGSCEECYRTAVAGRVILDPLDGQIQFDVMLDYANRRLNVSASQYGCKARVFWRSDLGVSSGAA